MIHMLSDVCVGPASSLHLLFFDPIQKLLVFLVSPSGHLYFSLGGGLDSGALALVAAHTFESLYLLAHPSNFLRIPPDSRYSGLSIVFTGPTVSLAGKIGIESRFGRSPSGQGDDRWLGIDSWKFLFSPSAYGGRAGRKGSADVTTGFARRSMAYDPRGAVRSFLFFLRWTTSNCTLKYSSTIAPGSDHGMLVLGRADG